MQPAFAFKQLGTSMDLMNVVAGIKPAAIAQVVGELFEVHVLRPCLVGGAHKCQVIPRLISAAFATLPDFPVRAGEIHRSLISSRRSHVVAVAIGPDHDFSRGRRGIGSAAGNPDIPRAIETPGGTNPELPVKQNVLLAES